MHERLEILADAAEKARDAWNDVYRRFKSSPLGVDHRYARLAHSSLHELNRRTLLTLELGISAGRVDENAEALLLPKVEGLLAQFNTIQRAAATISGAFDSFPDTTIADPSNNLDQVQFLRGGAQVSVQQLGPQFDQINVSAAAAFDALAVSLRYARNRGLGLLTERAEQLQGTYERFSALESKARDAEGALSKSAAEAGTQAAHASSAATAAHGQVESAEKSAKDAQGSAAEAVTKLEKVREVSAAAASLETQVGGYAAKFDAFDKSLSSMLGQHREFEETSKVAIAKNEERENEIDRLTEKADAMIQGATSAGLGYRLDQTRRLYQKRMAWARAGFIVSIGLLGVSAIPLAAQLLPGLFKGWVPVALPSAAASGYEELYSLLGKVFLLFPATWLTQFFSKSFSELFHLEREYAHKAALAQSVEGFKREAPEYGQAMTAEVFREVTFNPSRQPAPEPAAHPLYGVIAKKLEGKLPGATEPTPK